MELQKNSKVVVILGPTATGKSDLGVEVALQHNGEIISADSRQIYRGLNIGTGKITPEEMHGVPHHLLDIRDPNESYSAAEFKKDAYETIAAIIERGNTPFLVGGTGFFISSVVDNLSFPDVPPNHELREKLGEKTTEHLFELLQKRDPHRANTIDQYNRRRLIRALEIAERRDTVPPVESNSTPFTTLQIGLYAKDDQLRERIRTRLKKHIDSGMVEEVKDLHRDGLSYEALDRFGLEYRYIARYLRGQISLEEMEQKLETEIWRYAKRQKTWFKKDERIEWFSPDQRPEVFERVTTFLGQ